MSNISNLGSSEAVHVDVAIGDDSEVKQEVFDLDSEFFKAEQFEGALIVFNKQAQVELYNGNETVVTRNDWARAFNVFFLKRMASYHRQ
ncbi:MAG: hypothetical protein Q9M91_06565 [Candidatus Dojkabacteria bacterium]|nr:hypothetical protein [Candidatus Dojkabacteria bacterium]MDQ7021459.1 hypothetical protein [Candidatus Dojkabacteria bacterium]